ncbi:MAG: VOC family protein [bacterium]|nr:VOC family protein [bacterium]
MDLGPFLISLTVKDIDASRSFYESFGFSVIDGAHITKDFPLEEGQDWLILRKDSIGIGLFQGMFEQNIMTFHPPDVRGLQKHLKSKGISFDLEADEASEGGAHAMLTDPDGNLILMEQI